MNTEKVCYVYSDFVDARHKRVALKLNQCAFDDLVDYIEETKCACVEMRFDKDLDEIWFYHESDFFNTIQRFMNHQANIIVSQLHQLVNTPVDPF